MKKEHAYPCFPTKYYASGDVKLFRKQTNQSGVSHGNRCQDNNRDSSYFI